MYKYFKLFIPAAANPFLSDYCLVSTLFCSTTATPSNFNCQLALEFSLQVTRKESKALFTRYRSGHVHIYFAHCVSLGTFSIRKRFKMGIIYGGY